MVYLVDNILENIYYIMQLLIFVNLTSTDQNELTPHPTVIGLFLNLLNSLLKVFTYFVHLRVLCLFSIKT